MTDITEGRAPATQSPQLLLGSPIQPLTKLNIAFKTCNNCVDTGYPHDGRADNAAYRHDRRADKRRYLHDREIEFQMLKMIRSGYILS